MLRKNDRVRVTIEDYSVEGHGIAKVEGYVLFIPGGAVGDEAIVHVLKCRASFGYGKIVELLSPVPCRTESDCAVFHSCGGCSFRHITYEAELTAKADRVKNDLRRLGGIEVPPMLPIIGAENTLGYRNKAQYPIRLQQGKTVAGFYAAGSHRVIQCSDCRIQPDLFDRILSFTLKFMEENGLSAYDETNGKGLVRHLYLRRGEKSGEVMVCLVLNGSYFPDSFLAELQAAFPEVKCVCINENKEKTNVILGKKTRFLTERTYILDSLLGREFAISPASFYQVNPVQTERLYAEAARLADVQPEETVLDLYCGIGTVGMCAAASAKHLVGIEIVPQAIENARANARRNALTNTRYLCADAKNGVAQLQTEGYRFDTVFVDPPRKGCDTQTLETLV
ncbi:MAG: 23S rRNA (uracil(1939)-C(5))-methyltransferase RlmD, partial [Clostridia bacterium]|nr:23S rRNA (uracil(1939)-C(5))-methyltransferase RlmD [Clostridia bacterium]